MDIFDINFSFSYYSERINSHNAIQYYFMKVNRVSNPLIYLGFDDDLIEFSDSDDLFWDS